MKDKDTVSPKPDWAEPDDRGMIDVPDELMPLFNKVGTQLRFHTISGKSEVLTVAHIICQAEKFYGSRIAELRNELSEYKEANAVLGSDNQRLYDEAKTLFERIAELEKENAELDASEAGWFNSCTEYQKENDALIIENCALESRLQKANEDIQKYKDYCERNNLQGL